MFLARFNISRTICARFLLHLQLQNVIFLSTDAFGVLPPVSVRHQSRHSTVPVGLQQNLQEQALESQGLHLHSPACFRTGILRAASYKRNMQKSLLRRWRRKWSKRLTLNTGWNGTGKRISIKILISIIDAI